MKAIDTKDTETFFEKYLDMDVKLFDVDRCSFVGIYWRDNQGNKESAYAAVRPGMVQHNRAELVLTLVHGALQLGDGEALNDDVSFRDVLKLMSGNVTSGKELEDLKAKVYESDSCHENF